MEANVAPEKIYFTQTENGTHYYTEGIPFERNYIEYTRSDAFIEKAACYLNSKLYDWVRIEHPNLSASLEVIIKRDFIEDFKNYMKGE